MNAPANITTAPQRWAARPCHECEGYGFTSDGKGNGGNDPDSGTVECADCNGEASFACDVCGCDVAVTGFDCVVCETLENLTDLTAQQLLQVRGSFDEALLEMARIKTAQVSA